jgi:AmmeMemoRadiSam system protein B
MALFSREMVAAGSFYPLNADNLRKTIQGLFTKKPYKLRKGFLQGLIVPHAGYVYSGKTAAKAYYELSKHEPRTAVILGPNHTGMGEALSVMYSADYKTPLGKVNSDSTIGRSVCKELNISPDYTAHSREHSIEVQVPFLQFIYQDKARILPIILGDVSFKVLKQLGSVLAKHDATIIASSDFTHHGRVYGYSPFQNVKLELREHDMKAIELIQQLKVKEFHDLAEKSTICGFRPITVLMQAMKERGAKPKFLEYSTSADVTGDYENVVAYASLSFK